MKKLLLVVVLAALGSNSWAQYKGTFAYRFDTQFSLFQGSLKTVEIGMINFGYHITDRFYAGLRNEVSIGLFDPNNNGEETSWKAAENLGAVLEYNIGGPTLRISAGTTPGGKKDDWKYTYYSGGIYIQGRHTVSPSIGIGLRYYDSHTKMFDDYFRIFISVGFNVNWEK